MEDQNKYQKAINWLLYSMKPGKVYQLTRAQKVPILDVFDTFLMPLEKTKGYSYFYEFNNERTTITKHTFDYWGWVRSQTEFHATHIVVDEAINITPNQVKQLSINLKG